MSSNSTLATPSKTDTQGSTTVPGAPQKQVKKERKRNPSEKIKRDLMSEFGNPMHKGGRKKRRRKSKRKSRKKSRKKSKRRRKSRKKKTKRRRRR